MKMEKVDSMVVVLITGSLTYKDEPLMEKEIKKLKNKYIILVVRHGGAVGADNLAEKICRRNNIKTEIVTPKYDDELYSAPLERNIVMLETDERPILILAFYDSIKKGGTAFTANEARKRSIKVLEFGLKLGRDLKRFMNINSSELKGVE